MRWAPLCTAWFWALAQWFWWGCLLPAKLQMFICVYLRVACIFTHCCLILWCSICRPAMLQMCFVFGCLFVHVSCGNAVGHADVFVLLWTWVCLPTKLLCKLVPGLLTTTPWQPVIGHDAGGVWLSSCQSEVVVKWKHLFTDKKPSSNVKMPPCQGKTATTVASLLISSAAAACSCFFFIFCGF